MITKLGGRSARKGLTGVQTAFVMVLVGVGVIMGVSFLGTATQGELNQTASDVGDPSALVTRWGGEETPCPEPPPDDGDPYR